MSAIAGFAAVLDVKVPQQVVASPPTWTDRVVPFESAVSTTLASYRSGFGLGTEDSPTFTGLTLTGALSGAAGSFTTLAASGAIVSTMGNNTNLFYSSTATTGYQYISLSNTSGSAIFGVQGTATSLGGTGSSNYDMVLRGQSGVSISADAGVNTQARVSSTGLAVTGAVSATGNITATAAQVIGGSTGSSGNAWFRAGGSLASYSGIDIADNSDTSGANFAVWRNASTTAIGTIARVTTTDAVVYNTTSDGRLKTNVRDFTAEDAGRIIDGLKPRWFDWKSGTDNDSKNIIGFIAQEEAAVDPALARIGAVTVGDDDPETVTKQWQRSDAALIPILVAEIKALRARVAALENK